MPIPHTIGSIIIVDNNEKGRSPKRIGEEPPRVVGALRCPDQLRDELIRIQTRTAQQKLEISSNFPIPVINTPEQTSPRPCQTQGPGVGTLSDPHLRKKERGLVNHIKNWCEGKGYPNRCRRVAHRGGLLPPEVFVNLSLTGQTSPPRSVADDIQGIYYRVRTRELVILRKRESEGTDLWHEPFLLPHGEPRRTYRRKGWTVP